MSRIGKSPITIPEGVTVTIQPNLITVKGKLGELTQEYNTVSVTEKEGILEVSRPTDSKDHRAKHGLYRALIANMVQGVSEGFTKELELVGVGYRASHQGQKLDLALGFSHNIVLDIAPEVKVDTVSEKGPKYMHLKDEKYVYYANQTMKSNNWIGHSGYGGQFLMINLETNIVASFFSVLETDSATDEDYKAKMILMLEEVTSKQYS